MKQPSSFFLLALLVLSLSLPLSSYSPTVFPSGSLRPLAKLPPAVVESSGLETADQPGTYWTHNDAGNEPILYKVDEKGKLLQQIQVSGTTNTDWEDLSQDTQGHLYIGDVGNNSNKRRDLRIYKVAPKANFKAREIKFTYPDLPPGKISKKDRNFDCEAFFWHGGKLYLISKDRVASRTAKLYELSDTPGTHTARLLSKEELPGLVTSADLSPDGKHLAVLTYGKLYLYPVSKGSNQFFKNTPRVVDLPQIGKAEALVFKNSHTLVLSNEEGDLFQYVL